MISFEKFAMNDSSPIYLQIPFFIKREIAADNIKDGDELPSRRVLSAMLGVNPNTVQKAYRILEEENLIESHSGAKSFVVADEKKRLEIKRELLLTDAKNAVTMLKQMGVSKTEAIDLITQIWNEGE